MDYRTAQVQRRTKETEITVQLNLDGVGQSETATSVPFFDHMLEIFARHGLIDLTVHAQGDLHVDAHHTVEDVAICLGDGLTAALGDKKGISRFGSALVPMEECLAQVAIDLSGRASLVYHVDYQADKIGDFDVELVREFLRALAAHAKMNLHVNVPYGNNNHHTAEAIFKALGRCLRQALALDPRCPDVPSTKGIL